MKSHRVLRGSTCATATILVVLMIPLLFLACSQGGPTEPSTQITESLSNSPSAAGAAANAGGIDIEKSTDGEDADDAPGPSLFVGDSVKWTYEVTNTGDVELTEILVTDDQGEAVTCRNDRLKPGGSMTCRASGTVVEGPYVNIGTVVATLPDGGEVSDSDTSHYTGEVPPRGAIDIEKSTNGEDADESGPSLLVGNPVEWTYEVTNTGEVVLNQIEVSDDREFVVGCPKKTLEPGESMTCLASGTAVAGPYENIGTAVGSLPGGGTATDFDPSHYTGVLPDAAIEIEKSTNGADADAPPGPSLGLGDSVEWTYRVTNTGEVELTGIRVADDRLGAVSCPMTLLVPNASMTCTALGTAVAGQYRNIGTVVGSLPDGSEVSDRDLSHYIAREDDDSDGEKVDICHIPPGNPANRKVISVGASSVDDHLAHGDNLYEEVEVCDDGLDNNCDGQVDEGCP